MSQWEVPATANGFAAGVQTQVNQADADYDDFVAKQDARAKTYKKAADSEEVRTGRVDTAAALRKINKEAIMEAKRAAAAA